MAVKTLKINQAESQVAFKAKKLGLLTVNGILEDFTGQIQFDPADLTQSSFDIDIRVATINTGTAKRDEHLKSEDFFAVKTHPKISFKSSTIQKNDGQYTAIGQLTIMETSREISIPFDFTNGVFKGAFVVDRLDYNLGKKFPTFFIGKNIDISVICKVL